MSKLPDLPRQKLEGERGSMSFRTGRCCETKCAYPPAIYNPYDIYEGRSVDRDGYSRYSRNKVADTCNK